MTYGAQRFICDLRDLGFAVTEERAPSGELFAVISSFEVPAGKFEGRIIDLGLQCTPDFPRTVASAIHVRATPQLYEYADSIANVRNIQQSSLGALWRYWSHNFGWQGERSARRLISQINRIFLNAT